MFDDAKAAAIYLGAQETFEGLTLTGIPFFFWQTHCVDLSSPIPAGLAYELDASRIEVILHIAAEVSKPAWASFNLNPNSGLSLPSYLYKVMFTCAPVLRLCLFVSVNVNTTTPIP